jgi:hypothetical protein
MTITRVLPRLHIGLLGLRPGGHWAYHSRGASRRAPINLSMIRLSPSWILGFEIASLL